MDKENIFTIYKPQGPSSFTLISKIKKATGEPRVGHAGTLDPLAEGVLVVGLGRAATKKLNEIVKKEKEYLADIRLGSFSETDDEEGQKVKSLKVHKVHKVEVENVLKKFIGIINQIPPAYSAIKIKGRRSYELARAGQVVELKSRPVEIKNIKIIKYKYPNLKIKVITGPGVYIRSLARDIGQALGIGAYLAGLKRTRVGQFKTGDAVSIDKLAEKYFNRQIKILKSGGVGIIPTDTLYGLVGLAKNQKTVEKIYKIRERNPDKPLIILIGSVSDLKKFKVKIDLKTKKIIKKYWPGQISIILPADKKLEYLHRGTGSLAFRLPKDQWLTALLKKTGPLVAPSANPEGRQPALTVKQAKRYFSNAVDFYIDRGKLESEPSTLIKIEDGKIIVLRSGSVKANPVEEF